MHSTTASSAAQAPLRTPRMKALAVAAYLLGAFGLLIGVNGCYRHSTAATTVAVAPTPKVSVSRPERCVFRHVVQQPAWVNPFEETPIYAKIAGYVQEVNAEIGSRVKKNDVLINLWVPEMVQELKQKDAMVAQAKIEIDQAESAVSVAKARLQTATSLVAEAKAGAKRAAAQNERWKSELKRMQELATAKVLDEQTRDETLHQFRATEASLEEANAKIQTALASQNEREASYEKSKTDLNASRNNLELAKADQRRVTALVAYSQVRAPFDGIVTQRHVHTGHLLQPSEGSNEKKEPLLVVVRTDKVRVFLDVPEIDAVWIKPGMTARIRIPVLNDREFTGSVAGSSWSLNAEQRTLRAEVDFDNPDEVLRPGMYAHATVPVDHPDALSLPASAIVVRDGATFCMCVEDGKAVRSTIRVGAKERGKVELLRKLGPPSQEGERPAWRDFTGDEVVVTSGAAELTDGQDLQTAPQPDDKQAATH